MDGISVSVNGIVSAESHGSVSAKLADATVSATAEIGGVRLTGVVVMFDAHRGFGFVRRDNGKGDVFTHIKDVRGGSISVGDRVEFVIGEGRRGRPTAFNVTIV